MWLWLETENCAHFVKYTKIYIVSLFSLKIPRYDFQATLPDPISLHGTPAKTAAVGPGEKRPCWKTAVRINKAIFCRVSGWHSGYLLWGGEGQDRRWRMLVDILPCLPNLCLNTLIRLTASAMSWNSQETHHHHAYTQRPVCSLALGCLDKFPLPVE